MRIEHIQAENRIEKESSCQEKILNLESVRTIVVHQANETPGDPDDRCFEHLLAWIDQLRKVYQEDCKSQDAFIL